MSGSTLDEVLLPGIDTTAEILSSRYASAGQAEAGTVIVQVKDIKSLADYNRVLAYLKKLSNVSAVQPYYLVASDALFKLTTPQGRLGVARGVALGHTLINDKVTTTTEPTQPPPTEVGKKADPKEITPDLVYRLVP